MDALSNGSWSAIEPSYVLAAEAVNPLVPALNELLWGAVSFALLFLVMSKFVFPRLNKGLQERTANIEGKLDEAERERQQAQSLLREYEEKLAEAQTQARQTIQEARANAERLENELRAQAEEQAKRIQERAEQTIQAERERAVQQLRGEVAELAVDLATRVVGDSLDRERQLRLVDQYIQQLPEASSR